VRTPSPSCDENGFSLIEAVVATVIAVIAVLGLAHSFGAGRALINRFESARDALALCQHQMEMLVASQPTSDSLDVSKSPFGPYPVTVSAKESGTLSWTVTWVDDPLNGLGGNDYKRVDVYVVWRGVTAPDSVQLSRNFLAP
jgi:Tfp pilus assembly protein PilV